MDGDLVAGPATHDVIPELAAFLLGPRIGALVDWDDELRRLLQEIEELGFGGFHSVWLTILR